MYFSKLHVLGTFPDEKAEQVPFESFPLTQLMQLTSKSCCPVSSYAFCIHSLPSSPTVTILVLVSILSHLYHYHSLILSLLWSISALPLIFLKLSFLCATLLV